MTHRSTRGRRAVAIAALLGLAGAAPALAGGPCAADLDADGTVAFGDLTLLLAEWGACDDPCAADLDGDGSVAFSDLLMLLEAYGADCTGGEPVVAELAARPLDAHPWAAFDRTWLETDPAAGRLVVAIDPAVHPEVIGQPVDVWVVADRSASDWANDAVLVDVRGTAQPATFEGPGLADAQVAIDGDLSGEVGLSFGQAYDLVVDVDRDGRLGAGDLIDGLDAAGFHVVGDTTAPGPLDVSATLFSSGVPFGAQITRFPTEGGPYPLVVISHGNGHSNTWYAYLQNHLASYGYVVTSHQNDTQPGIQTASQTTLLATDYIIENRETVANGALAGKIDPDRIIWIGHSRGGEGVVRAYDRIREGSFTPSSFSLSDIRLISSIAPTDFLGPAEASPGRARYHLIYGAADGDVSGDPGCAVCQSFSLFERASGDRWSTYLHAADHNDFNCCGFQDYCFGGNCPPALGRENVQTITKAVYLTLLEAVIRDRTAARDFLERQWEDLQPVATPTSTVANEWRPDPTAQPTNAFVIDDFQSASSLASSSSGGSVSATVLARSEGRLDDANGSFTPLASDVMNGMTRGRGNDSTRGTVFEWTSASFLEFEVVAGGADFTARTWLTWRSAAATRDGLNSGSADVDYTVVLIDGDGAESAIRLTTYGGGVQKPFARTGAGTGSGWQNEFETHRIRIADFARDGREIDLSDIVAVRFEFGGDAGTSSGRIGFDDLMVLDR